MTEQLEEQESQSFDLQHYLGIVRRRHLHFLLADVCWMAFGMGGKLGVACSI